MVGEGMQGSGEVMAGEGEMAPKRMLIIHSGDNVGVVLEDVGQGSEAVFREIRIVAREDIEFAHKIALKDIRTGEEIIKYGNSIGYALKEIRKGEWVHVHNIDCDRARVGRLV
jgi:altronate dehydratase